MLASTDFFFLCWCCVLRWIWYLWCYSECISTPGELGKYARPRWESNLRPFHSLNNNWIENIVGLLFILSPDSHLGLILLPETLNIFPTVRRVTSNICMHGKWAIRLLSCTSLNVPLQRLRETACDTLQVTSHLFSLAI